jgi:hypothetical protein
MKLITRTKMSSSNLGIHKFYEVVAITQEVKVRNTYLLMVLDTKDEMACWKLNLRVLLHDRSL